MSDLALDLDSMSIMERLALLDEESRETIIRDLSEMQLADMGMWLRPKQLDIIKDPAPLVVMAGGRGSGKTRVGASWTVRKAEVPGTRLHLVARTVGDVRDVMIQGESGIMNVSPPNFKPEYHPSIRRLLWPNGSIALTFSAENPDMLRGPQADATWADELGTWRWTPDASGATAWDHVKIGTRLGRSPQVLVTTTPRRNPIIRELFKQAMERDGKVALYGGSTMENRANLAPSYLENLLRMYAGTALEQQEIYGVLIDVVPGALWRETDFVYMQPADLDSEIFDVMRLVTIIGVDPGVTKGGDATGIVTVRGDIAAPLPERRVWVRRDDTEPNLSPDQWAARIVTVWQEETESAGQPAIVVAEKNQGGALIETVIRQTPGGEKIPIALIDARGSKAARAEPVVLTYRRNRVFHEQPLEELQDEMTGWEPEVSGWSPNRIDALVHAVRAITFDDAVLRRFGSLTVASGDLLFPESDFHRGRAGASMTSPFRDPENPRERL